MDFRLNRWLYAVLPAVGILALVCGPSPSAAYAVACDRQVRHSAAQPEGEIKSGGCKLPAIPVDDNTPGGLGDTSKSKPPQQSKPKSLSSFVAPRAAKPSESKPTDLTPAIAAGHPFDSGLRILRTGIVGEGAVSMSGRHKPAYWAHGPP
jgi:hypothetical protein